MVFRRPFLILLSLFLCLSAFAQEPPAQDPGAASRTAMEKLSWLVGSWKGEGSIVLGVGEKKKFLQVEDVQTKLGGLVMLVEGLAVDSEDQEVVVHSALALINYDPVSKKYVLQPFLSNGQGANAKVTVGEKELVWSMDTPGVGQIRYTAKLNEKGEWEEVGELSNDDGKTWFKFMEMKLQKVVG